MNAASKKECEDAFNNMNNKFPDGIDDYVREIGSSMVGDDNHHPNSITCEVSVKRMDYLGKEYAGDKNKDMLKAHLSYLKLINVPSMFDIGCTQADP